MLHPDRSRIRRPALAILALAAASALAQQAVPAPEDPTAAPAPRSTSVGRGIGYGVDAERQRVAAQVPRDTAPSPLTKPDEAAPWQRSARRAYAGAAVGQSTVDADCGAGAFECSGARPALHLFAGSSWNDNFGLELGYRFLGRAERGGGHAEAHSLGLSLVGQLPVGPLGLFAKAGVAYGRTRVSADPASGLRTGPAGGWSGSWGGGLSWGLTPASSLVLEWASVELPIAGTGKSAFETTSIGFVHHF